MEPKKAAIRLNKKELKKAAIDLNLETDAQIAEAIGVSKWMLSRVFNEIQPPSSAFIAGVLRAFGEPFDRFFFSDESVVNATTRDVE